jgi:hypothetical protein
VVGAGVERVAREVRAGPAADVARPLVAIDEADVAGRHRRHVVAGEERVLVELVARGLVAGVAGGPVSPVSSVSLVSLVSPVVPVSEDVAVAVPSVAALSLALPVVADSPVAASEPSPPPPEQAVAITSSGAARSPARARLPSTLSTSLSTRRP